MEAPAMHPSSVWVAVAGDLREAPEGMRGDVGELTEIALDMAAGRRWAVTTTPAAMGTMSSTTPAATQVNHFSYHVLERSVSTPNTIH
jgi:hypothetical protein